jgi:hypothetical protein
MSQTESAQTTNRSTSPDFIFFSSGELQLRTETPSQVDLSPAEPAKILDIPETVLTPEEYGLPEESLHSKKKRNQKPPRSKRRKIDRRREAVRVKAIANSESLHLRESRRSGAGDGGRSIGPGAEPGVITPPSGGVVDGSDVCFECGLTKAQGCAHRG